MPFNACLEESMKSLSLIAASALFLALSGFAQEEKMVTRTYQLSKDIFDSFSAEERDKIAAFDPFANPPAVKDFGQQVNPEKAITALKLLEFKGLNFGPGATAAYDPSKKQLAITNSELQIELLEVFLEEWRQSSEKLIHVIVEYIEVEHTDFSDWLFENRLTGNATPLRKELQKWVKEKRGTILDTALVVARSGQRAKTEAIDEFIYPTEMDPPEIPNQLTITGPLETAPITPQTPTAFETRNLGTTLEVDPVLGADNVTIDLNLSPEIVNLAGYTHWLSEETDPFFRIQMPKFHAMKTTTQVTLIDGEYGLLGSSRPTEAAVEGREDPYVLIFVRADIATTVTWKIIEDKAN